MPDLASEWLSVIQAIDDQLFEKAFREIQQEVAWFRNNSFSNLAPRFEFLATEFPNFFNRTNYSWIMDADSYAFPQEILLQNYALEVLLSLHFFRSDLLPQNMPPLCTRLTSHWNIMDGVPHALPRKGDFFFVAVPMAWLDLISFTVSAILSSDYETYRRIFPRLNLHNSKLTENDIFNSLTARLAASRLNAPEWFQLEALSAVCEQLKFEPHSRAMSDNSMRMYLEPLCSRFVIGHELGHIFEHIRAENSSSYSEIYADQIAALGLRYHMLLEPAHYEAMKPRSDVFITTLACELFYIVYEFWLISSEAISGNSPGDGVTKHSARSTFTSRKRHFESLRGTILINDGITKLSEEEQVWIMHLRNNANKLTSNYKAHLASHFENCCSLIDEQSLLLMQQFPDPWDLGLYRTKLEEAIAMLRKTEITTVNEAGETTSITLQGKKP